MVLRKPISSMGFYSKIDGHKVGEFGWTGDDEIVCGKCECFYFEKHVINPYKYSCVSIVAKDYFQLVMKCNEKKVQHLLATRWRQISFPSRKVELWYKWDAILTNILLRYSSLTLFSSTGCYNSWDGIWRYFIM